jgi:hypothetical protein
LLKYSAVKFRARELGPTALCRRVWSDCDAARARPGMVCAAAEVLRAARGM